MAVTRSMSATTQTADTHSVTNAESRAIEEVDADDKFFDLDEMTLALGIFLRIWKEEHLKKDPDFIFTPVSYQAAKREFDYLGECRKASYLAQAKKRNSVKIHARPVKASRKPRKLVKLPSTLMAEAMSNFLVASKKQYLKTDPNFKFTKGFYHGGSRKDYGYLNDDDKAPYIAEAMERHLAQHAAWILDLRASN